MAISSQPRCVPDHPTLPELPDIYRDRFFGYRWCLLRNRENAQIAVPARQRASTPLSGSLSWNGDR
jgi:hypothetical protein